MRIAGPSISQRFGFTLVELLVVIAIIGVLVSLLLPAVQSAREAARRLQCTNQLKQLSLALLTYENQIGQLPASGIVDMESGDQRGYPGFEPRSGKMFSWIVLLLPFIEQQPLHDAFNFDVAITEQNGEPQSTQLPLLTCPSDQTSGRIYENSTLAGRKRYAKGNYAAYVSPYHIDLQLSSPGALISGRKQRVTDIVDGTSQTWALSEVRARDHVLDERGVWALPWTGASLLAFDLHELKGVSDEGDLGPYEPAPASLGLTQLPNGDLLNGDTLYTCPLANEAALEGMKCIGGTNYLSAAPRSQHPGGVFVAFVDGHVEFVNNGIDEIVMAYRIAINDGRAINE